MTLAKTICTELKKKLRTTSSDCYNYHSSMQNAAVKVLQLLVMVMQVRQAQRAPSAECNSGRTGHPCLGTGCRQFFPPCTIGAIAHMLKLGLALVPQQLEVFDLGLDG